MPNSVRSVGFWAALVMAVLTIITFAIAILTPPLAGPFCREECFEYPYADITSRFPRDYYWMYPATLLFISYVILTITIESYASPDKKIFARIGLFFSGSAALIFLSDFFLQLSVVQPSLIKGEMDGISLLSQFNPHGVFIVLEELGYILMAIAFIFMAPIFIGDGIKKAIRWVFRISGILTLAAFGIIGAMYGLEREYVFEVVSISINWLTLIVSGFLLSTIFKKEINKNEHF